MRYIFYGLHQETIYNPYVADYYGAKVPTLGAYTRTVSVEEFFRRDNVHVEIKEGTYINIGDERVYIKRIEYDILDDSYKCYTEKVLSCKEGNMSKIEAERKLEEIRNKGVSGFIRGLFGLNK